MCLYFVSFYMHHHVGKKRLSAILKYVCYTYPFRIIQTYWIFHILFLFALFVQLARLCVCVWRYKRKIKTENMNIFYIRQHEFYIMIDRMWKKPVKRKYDVWTGENEWVEAHTPWTKIKNNRPVSRATFHKRTSSNRNAKRENKVYRCFESIMKWTFFTFTPSAFFHLFLCECSCVFSLSLSFVERKNTHLSNNTKSSRFSFWTPITWFPTLSF